MKTKDYKKCFIAAFPEDINNIDAAWVEQTDFVAVGNLTDGRVIYHCIVPSRILKNLVERTNPSGRIYYLGRTYKDLLSLDSSIWESVIECTWSGKDVNGNTIIFRDKIAMKKAVAPAKAYLERKIISHQYAGWEVDEPQDI